MTRIPPRPPPNPSARVRQGVEDLRKNAVEYAPEAETLKEPTPSPHFEQLKGRVGDAGMSRMFERNQKVATLLHNGQINPSEITDAIKTRADRGKLAKPKVKRHVMGNSYEARTNTVRLMEPTRTKTHFAAHEFRHAYDHTQGKLDFNKPEQRLMGELNAFGSQIKAAGEMGVDPGLHGRDAHQSARTYEGKSADYPGTLESSQDAVKKWRESK